ncbi:hypothetical protein [Bacillus atrophaeus]|uniref:hypothetical protein n=1 Tax=Bacillus atrophaeus TaxID=1452 RepID=UPI002E1E8ACC|nr:hypothetical protein [Bacillus atrophaeus]
MKKFEIKQFETIVNTYEVEAEDINEALMLLKSNTSGDFIRQEDLLPEPNYYIGIPFEQAPEELDQKLIRSEFNNDKSSDFLESIFDIKELPYGPDKRGVFNEG